MKKYRERVYRRYFTASYGAANPVEGPSHALRLRALKDLLLPWLPSDRQARIVDLGCGTGYALEMLLREGYDRVEGVDVSDEQVAVARARGLPVVQGDLFAYLSGYRESVDVLLLLDLLEHLDRDELLDLLERAVVALRPGGRVVVKTANANAPTGLRMLYKDLTHELVFTEHSLRTAFLIAGLRPVAIYGERIRPASVAGVGRWLLGCVTRGLWRLFLVGELGREGLGIPVEFNLIGVAEKPVGTGDGGQ